MFQELFLGFHVCHLIPQQSQEEGSVIFFILQMQLQMKGTEWLSNLPKVTQEGSGKSRV